MQQPDGMQQQPKKNFLIPTLIVIGIIVILAGIGVWWYLSQSQSDNPVIEETSDNDAVEETSDNPVVEETSDNDVISDSTPDTNSDQSTEKKKILRGGGEDEQPISFYVDCPVGKPCVEGFFCEEGSYGCFNSENETICTPLDEPCKDHGLTGCPPNEPNCIEPGDRGSGYQICAYYSDVCYVQIPDSDEFICVQRDSFNVTAVCPSGYSACLSFSNYPYYPCRQVGDTWESDTPNSSTIICRNGVKCLFGNGDGLCIAYDDTCPEDSIYEECPEYVRSCRQVGDSWTGNEEDSNKFICNGGYKCVNDDGSGKCVASSDLCD